ncbi:auxin-binding protein ABP19a-like protein, partial [Tanacetum coccineum]
MVRLGSVKAGFRTSAKKVFVKTLKKDDIMVIPQGLEHFIQDANEVASVQQNGVSRRVCMAQ